MEENIKILSKKCKNKKVIFYCIGELFKEIHNKFNLDELFNIQALCDIKFSDIEKCNNYKAITPQNLKSIECDFLIIVSPDFKNKKSFLEENKYLNKKTKILNIYQKKIKIDVRKNYKNVLKTLKNKEKIKILFTCEQNEKWCYTDLYRTLQKSEKFEVLPVVLYPIISKGEIISTQEKNKLFFDELNISSLNGWDDKNNKLIDIKKFEPDIVFYQQPWYLNNANHPKFVSSYALTIMAPYGYTTLNEKFWGSDSVKEVYQNLWLFLAESKYHINFYKKAAKMKNNLVAIGSLKLDNYQKPILNNPFKKPENLKIIYAPHHSLENDGLKMSTFKENYQHFLNFAKNNPQYSFIFKPHPMLENAVIEHKLMTKEEYQNYLYSWNNLENSSIYDKGEYFDLFKSSDILITDCSSFLAEYFPTKKPVIFLNRADRAPFDKFGQKIKKGFYEVNQFFEIEELIKNIIQNDPLKKTRETILKKEFYIKGLAFKKIIQILDNLRF